MQFRSVVQLSGKSATGIPIPPEVVTSLGESKRPAVSVTIKGYTYRTSVGSMGGQFMLPLSAENRQKAGVAAGDEVEVEIELDDQPREVSLPADFAAALEQDAAAKQYFESLAYSHKQRHVLPIEQAKTAETRQKRIEKTIATLHEGKA